MTSAPEKRKRIALMPHQLEVIKYRGKMGGIKGGTGSSKTHSFCWWLIKRLKNAPRQQAFIVGADYDQLRRGIFATLVGILNDIGAKRFRYRENPTPMIVFANGARIRTMSARIAERIRSVEIDTLLLEEPQTWDNGKAVYDTLIERLRTSPIAKKHYGDRLQPQLRMSFNPPTTSHWLYDLIEKQWPKDGYRCWTFSVRKNRLMPRQAEYIAMLESRYPPALWPSKIDGQWLAVSGGVFPEFVADIHGVVPDGLPPLAINDSRAILWMHDFNVGQMTSIIAQMHSQTPYRDGVIIEMGKPPRDKVRLPNPNWQRHVLYILDEIVLPNAGVRAVAKHFIERYGERAKRGKGVILMGDPAGNSRQQADLDSNFAVLGEELTRAGIPWTAQVAAADPGVEPRVNALRAQFENGDGYGVVVDVDSVPVWKRDMLEVTWGPDGKLEKKKDTTLTHAADATCYGVHRLRKIAAARAAQKTPRRPTDFLAR